MFLFLDIGLCDVIQIGLLDHKFIIVNWMQQLNCEFSMQLTRSLCTVL